MISYRDMTFCALSDSCKWAENCSRALTEEVIKHANEVGLPLSVASFGCYTAKEKGDKQDA
jgi:hypothetical protein